MGITLGIVAVVALLVLALALTVAVASLWPLGMFAIGLMCSDWWEARATS